MLIFGVNVDNDDANGTQKMAAGDITEMQL